MGCGPAEHFAILESGETVFDAVHDVWIPPTPATPGKLQLMLDEANGEDWISRRDSCIRRPGPESSAFSRGQRFILQTSVRLIFSPEEPPPNGLAKTPIAPPTANPGSSCDPDAALAADNPVPA